MPAHFLHNWALLEPALTALHWLLPFSAPRTMPHPSLPGLWASSLCGLCCSLSLGSWGQGWPPDLGLRPHLTAAHDAPTFPQDDSDGSIECVNEERRLHKKVCNVSYPFFRAKAKVETGAWCVVGPRRVRLGRGVWWARGRSDWGVVYGGPGAGQGGTGGGREVEENRGADRGGTDRPEGGF